MRCFSINYMRGRKTREDNLADTEIDFCSAIIELFFCIRFQPEMIKAPQKMNRELRIRDADFGNGKDENEVVHEA